MADISNLAFSAFMQHRMLVLRGLSGLFCVAATLLVFTIGMSAGRCYVEPCYEGSGYDVLWELNRGSSFTAITTSLAVCVHSSYVARVAFQQELGVASPPSEQAMSMLLLSCVFATMLTIQLFVDWQGKALMLIDLDSRRFFESGREMKVDGTTKHLFEANAVFSGTCFFSHLFVAFLLRKFQEEICASGISGESRGTYQQIGSDNGSNSGYADIGGGSGSGYQSARRLSGEHVDL